MTNVKVIGRKGDEIGGEGRGVCVCVCVSDEIG